MIAMLRVAAEPKDYRHLHATLLGRFRGAQQYADRMGSEKLAVRAKIATPSVKFYGKKT